MNNFSESLYLQEIQKRSRFKFLIGLIPRYFQWRRHEKARRIARKRGAIIGYQTVLPITLAKRANKNLIVGDHTSIQSDKIDLRSPVTIGNHVIIGNSCEIITTSHQLDSKDWEHKYYGIIIEDYVWIATKVLILPSCRKIEFGATIAAGSVAAKNVEKMNIVAGNPAVFLRLRKEVHSNLVVESLLGGDLKVYWNAWINKK